VPGVVAARAVVSAAPLVAVGMLDPVDPADPVDDDEFEVVSEGIVNEILTFDDPPVADDLPPVAVDMPIPPTDDEFELVVAVDVADVPMLFRLDPPPCPIPVDVDPDNAPEFELDDVCAWANEAAQDSSAHASCSVFFFMMVLRNERERHGTWRSRARRVFL
jgi:hypothetical protein